MTEFEMQVLIRGNAEWFKRMLWVDYQPLGGEAMEKEWYVCATKLEEWAGEDDWIPLVEYAEAFLGRTPEDYYDKQTP